MDGKVINTAELGQLKPGIRPEWKFPADSLTAVGTSLFRVLSRKQVITGEMVLMT